MKLICSYLLVCLEQCVLCINKFIGILLHYKYPFEFYASHISVYKIKFSNHESSFKLLCQLKKNIQISTVCDQLDVRIEINFLWCMFHLAVPMGCTCHSNAINWLL